jgi:hypothetical protein
MEELKKEFANIVATLGSITIELKGVKQKEKALHEQQIALLNRADEINQLASVLTAKEKEDNEKKEDKESKTV